MLRLWDLLRAFFFVRVIKVLGERLHRRIRQLELETLHVSYDTTTRHTS